MKRFYQKMTHFLIISTLFCTPVIAQTIEIGTEPFELTFIDVGDDWQYLKGLENPSDAWKTGISFSEPNWQTGPSGFGYADSDDNTILNDMEDNYKTVYIRNVFTASSVPQNAQIQLIIDYDDAFIAYLNGAEVAQRNMSLQNGHEAGSPVTIPLGTASDLLNEGDNLLAIEGHNLSLDSSDFSLIPALKAVSDSDYQLTEDTTWSGTYLLKSTVIVPQDVVLTIEPGSVIMMKSGVEIKVHGQLLAVGTETDQITFTHEEPGKTWERIMFIQAQPSRLENCIIEYSNCEGDHKDYYDTDCDDQTPLSSRDYFQAVVAIACHVDIEGCLFQHLPNDTGSREGDAIAIISDDPDIPGDATAYIGNCRFISIGQAVHTRFSYVLVEECYFTGHHGDNDDIDLYGESTPPPMILNNIMVNPGHDDMINPTRCSAIIIGNIIAGCDDHGIVLRDKCSPVLINNLIYDCSSAGIAVQNQCDALLINNTIVNCGRGIRFFDHTSRRGPPYCLFPGSGKATMINCIIWDCPDPIVLTDSPYEQDPGSHITVSYCNIQGGEASASVSSNSTLTWGDGNFDLDPLFADLNNGDLHLKSLAGRWDPAALQWVKDSQNSPCIDTGDPTETAWTKELWPHGGRVNIGTYGGTPEASMSGNQAGNIADVNHDDIVNLQDAADFATEWNLGSVLLDIDLDRNGVVNFADLAILADNWLR